LLKLVNAGIEECWYMYLARRYIRLRHHKRGSKKMEPIKF
jgi:hypothetical protein